MPVSVARTRNRLMIATLAALISCSPDMDKTGNDVQHPVVIGREPILNPGDEPPAGPGDISFRKTVDSNSGPIGSLRRDALRSAARAYGSQHGFQRRVWEINKVLEQHTATASTLFDFNRVVAHLPGGNGIVIPPVMAKTIDNQQLSDNASQLATSDMNLVLLRPGRLSVTTPTIFDYLVIPSQEPVIPEVSLLPNNGEEADMFSTWFNEGWQAGRHLARDEFSTRLQRLLDDYDGMMEYRRLVENGIMTRMVLTKSDFGTTVLDDTMRIGDKVVQVESEAEFRPDGDSIGARDRIDTW